MTKYKNAQVQMLYEKLVEMYERLVDPGDQEIIIDIQIK